MLSQISTPHFGLNFLSIAKEYCNETNTKNKLEQAIKIIIFSATGDLIQKQIVSQTLGTP